MTIDWRRVLVVELALLAGCALLVVVGWVVGRFAHTVLLLGLGIVVAFALGPLVGGLEGRLGGRRGLAAAIVYLALLVVVVGGVALLAQPFVQQLTQLVGDLPRYADMVKSQLPGLQERAQALGLPVELSDLQRRAVAFASEQMGTVLGGTLALLTGLTNLVVDLALVVAISFYLVLDSRRIRDTLISLVPPSRRQDAIFIEETTVRIAGGYLRGQLALGLVMGLMGVAGALLFGLPYPLIIGVVAGVTELIPMIGPVLGAVLPVMLALLQPFPTVIWVILYMIAVQQLESNLLVPRISGEAVGLHPLAAMLALMAGLELAGLLGGLFAVPVAGVLYVLLAALYRRLRQGDRPPPRQPQSGWRLPTLRGRRTGGPARRTSEAPSP
ncbi:MAG TPA: AI-2E family transporter [Chloroflexota bacterium]|jgi:predicted PurR-regulated permease PerM